MENTGPSAAIHRREYYSQRTSAGGLIVTAALGKTPPANSWCPKAVPGFGTAGAKEVGVPAELLGG
jgi:hypothetical protein